MIDQFVELGVGVLELVLLASWRAIPVFVVVAGLSLLVRKRVPARYLCWLWLIVIARLLLPVSVESKVAMGSVVDERVQKLFAADDELTVESKIYDSAAVKGEHGETETVALLAADETAKERAEADVDVAGTTDHDNAAYASSSPETQTNYIGADRSFGFQTSMTSDHILYIVVFFFGLPAIAMFMRGVVSHIRFAWNLRFMPTVEGRDTVDCLLRVCDELGVGRRPRIKEVPSLYSPAVFGLFRPVVCLPCGWRERLTPERLDWVFRHEMAHVKGRDGLLLFVANLAKSLHWFNPLSWIAVAKLQQRMERAADELATRTLSESKVREYGKLLLEFAAGQTKFHRSATVGLLAMAAPRGIQDRIHSLACNRPKRIWLRRMAMLPVIMMIGVSGLTDGKTIESAVTPPRQALDLELALAGADWRSTNPLAVMPADGDTRKVSINVENALRKATELQPGVDAEKFVTTYFGWCPQNADNRDTKIVDGVMTTLASPQQEAVMRQMLSAFEQSGLWQIVVQVRMIETDVRLLNQVDWTTHDPQTYCKRLSEPPNISDLSEWAATFAIDESSSQTHASAPFAVKHSVSVPLRIAKITQRQSERLLDRIQADRRSNVLHAPKVTFFNGQCGFVQDVVQRPFVTDVSVIDGDIQNALQPVISVFELGWTFRLKPTATADEKTDLQMVLTQSHIDNVRLASLPSMAGGPAEGDVTIQVPIVQSDSIAVTSMLSDDEVLLVFSPKPYAINDTKPADAADRSKCQLFMIQTQLILDQDFLKSFAPETSR